MRLILVGLTIAAALTLKLLGAEPPKEPAKVQYTTPEELFKAFRESGQKKDSLTYWNCCTPKLREELLYEQFVDSQLHASKPTVQAVLKKHAIDAAKFDEQFAKAYQKKHGVAWDKDKPLEEEFVLDVVSSAIVDQPGFFVAMQKVLQENRRPAKIGELKSLSIVGKRAVVYTTSVHYSISQLPGQPQQVNEDDMPLVLVFHNTEKGWLIGSPHEE